MNKCELCEVNYKLPQYPDSLRLRICMTCETSLNVINTTVFAIIYKRSKRSNVSGDKYIQRLLKFEQ